jgi:hypothetical protein
MDIFESESLFKFYNDRKAKVKHRDLNFNYWVEILEKMIMMFDYENTPDGIDTSFVERYLLLNGSVGLAKSNVNDGYVAFRGGFSDDLNEYGIGQNYIGATCLSSYGGKIGTDLVVGINNSLYMDRLNIIDRYSGLLANIEESMAVGIVNSRIVPLLEAATDKDKAQIEKVIDDIRNGKLATIASSDTISLFDEVNDTVKVHNITDPNSIAKLQYYSRFYEDTLKRLWVESGVEITNKDKAAQVTEGELNSFKQYSRITIEDMLKCREKMCDDFNALYKTEWSVKLNHIFDNNVTNEDGELGEEPEEPREEGADDGAGNNEHDK